MKKLFVKEHFLRFGWVFMGKLLVLIAIRFWALARCMPSVTGEESWAEAEVERK